MDKKVLEFLARVKKAVADHLPGRSSVLSPAHQHEFQALVGLAETLEAAFAPAAPAPAPAQEPEPEPEPEPKE